MKKKISKNSFLIKTQTWSKDSNELFDYECADLTKSSFSGSSNGFITRTNNEVKFTKEVLESKSSKVLLKVSLYNSQFCLINNFEEKNNKEMPWISMRHLKSKSNYNGYVINKGDVIKLGRVSFHIREIKLEKNDNLKLVNTAKDNNNNIILPNNIELNSFHKKVTTELKDMKDIKEEIMINPMIDQILDQMINPMLDPIINQISRVGSLNAFIPSNQMKTNSKKICRICYCDDKEVGSPLLNPCNCSGGVKYIHLTCLQSWLKSRCVIRSVLNNNCMIYTVKQIECEICKGVLPDFVKCQNKMYEIWDFMKPDFKNYLCLEMIITDKQSLKNLYIINLDFKNVLTIGRSHDADLRITDISVSRFHAQITRYPDDTLRFEDNSSKFGSLVLLQHPKVPINLDQCLPLQIGRTLITAIIKKPFKFFNCFSCGTNSPKKEMDYCIVNIGQIEIDKILSVKIQNEDESCSYLNTSSMKIKKGSKDEACQDLSNNYILTSSNNNESCHNEKESKKSKESDMMHTDKNQIRGKSKNRSFILKGSNYLNNDYDNIRNKNLCNTILNPNYIEDNIDRDITRKGTIINIANNNEKEKEKGKENININNNESYQNNNVEFVIPNLHLNSNKKANFNKRHSVFNFNYSQMALQANFIPVIGNKKIVNNNNNNINLTPKLNISAFKRYEEDIISNDVINLVEDYSLSGIAINDLPNCRNKMDNINIINEADEEICNKGLRTKNNYNDYYKHFEQSEFSSVKETERNNNLR